MATYYNEIDPFAAEWLRTLIATGLIAEGDVDTRSIEDVVPADLTGYTQCHFFAGLGGWSYALRLAGWPDDRRVWTGSCPCQPFSAAGKRGGVTDERHLWPALSWLIRQCKPNVIFGEQVASKDGRNWLDLVQTDLEAMGFAVGAGDICAAGVGAPHIRQRLYFVADSDGGMADDGRERWIGREGVSSWCVYDRSDAGRVEGHDGPVGLSETRNVSQPAGPVNGHWRDADWLLCIDGKVRPVEPGTFPLAHGIPGRVGRLRAYGNAIVPQDAAEMIAAYMEGGKPWTLCQYRRDYDLQRAG